MNAPIVNAAFNLSLPEDQLESILYHSSFQPLSSEIRSKNKAFTIFGSAIIEATYSLYLYQNDIAEDYKEYALLIDHVFNKTASQVYSRYELEQYVYCSSGEQGREHTDIVPRIVALVYMNCGFGEVYKVLLPFFRSLPTNITKDSKTLIQEYAQSKKLQPSYQVIGTFGPEHEKTFECMLTVGKESVCAKAIGKKNAEKAAAERFVTHYHVSQLAKRPNFTTKSKTTYIFPRSREDIAKLYSLLNLPSDYLRTEVLNEALIHSSALNNHKDKSIRSYDRLSIMGSYILYMLCSQYIVENYDLETISFVSERAALSHILY